MQFLKVVSIIVFISFLALGCGSSGDGGEPDTDGDGIVDINDNCPNTTNSDQVDSDGDGTGDACDETPNPIDSDGEDFISNDFTEDMCPRTELIIEDIPDDGYFYNSPFSFDNGEVSVYESGNGGNTSCYYSGIRTHVGGPDDGTVQNWSMFIRVDYRHAFWDTGDFDRCGDSSDTVIEYEDSIRGPKTNLIVHSAKRNIQSSGLLDNAWVVTNFEGVITEAVNNAVAAGVGASCP